MNEIFMPKGWKCKKISELADSYAGGTPKTRVEGYWKDGTVPWLRSGELEDTIIKKSESFITSRGLKESSAKLWPPNSVLIALTGATTGKTGLLTFESSGNQSVVGILPCKELAPKYLWYYLRYSYDYFWGKAVGGAQPHINGKIVSEREIIYPDIDIQKKIIQKLDYILGQLEEKKIEVLKLKKLYRIINFPKYLEKILLNDAFDRKFTHNEITLDQRTSHVVGDYIKIQNGYSFKSDWFTDNGIKLVRNINIGHGTINWEKSVYLEEEQAKKFLKFKLSEGDILISLDRPIISTGLKIARVTKDDLPVLLLQRVGKVTFLTDEILPDFFYLWLRSPKFIKKINPGRSSGIPHISSKEIENIPFNLLRKIEQRKIIKTVNEKMILLDKIVPHIHFIAKTNNMTMTLLEKLPKRILNQTFSGRLLN